MLFVTNFLKVIQVTPQIGNAAFLGVNLLILYLESRKSSPVNLSSVLGKFSLSNISGVFFVFASRSFKGSPLICQDGLRLFRGVNFSSANITPNLNFSEDQMVIDGCHEITNPA